MTAAVYAALVGRKGEYPWELAESARAALLRFKGGENPRGRALSNKECGALLGTSDATISDVAGESVPKDKHPKRQMQLALALALIKHLGCSLDDLFFNEGVASTPRTHATAAEIAAAVVEELGERRGSRITAKAGRR